MILDDCPCHRHWGVFPTEPKGSLPSTLQEATYWLFQSLELFLLYKQSSIGYFVTVVHQAKTCENELLLLLLQSHPTLSPRMYVLLDWTIVFTL